MRGRQRRIKSDARNKGERSGRPNLPAAGGDLQGFADTGRTIDERFGCGIELDRKKDTHRQEADQNPPAQFFDVFLVESAGHDEDEREMKEVAAKTEAGDEKERFDSQVRFEHDQRDEPRKYSDDGERQDPGGTRKQPGLDREQ